MCLGSRQASTTVSAGGWNTCVVTTLGGAKCWGENAYGVVGDGTTTDRLTPVNVSGLSSGVAQVSVGYYHACALTTVGGVKCWGENVHGELGDGTTLTRLSPVNVAGLTSGVTSIATGLDHAHHDHTSAVTSAGGVKCWGDNQYGELGDGTTTDRTTPVDVSGLASGVVAVFAGGTATCAVTTTGGAKCWGHNDAGQLGDGTTTDRTTPVDVSGLGSGVSSIAMSQSSAGEGIGGSHTCAVTTAGAAHCWGNNDGGMLGDGTTTERTTPVDVSGLSSGMVGVAVNFWDGCAISSAGGVKCWGPSEVGDGTSIDRLTPVDVSGSFFRTECPTLVASPHTSFVLSNGYTVGSVATFSSDTGYALVGATNADLPGRRHVGRGGPDCRGPVPGAGSGPPHQLRPLERKPGRFGRVLHRGSRLRPSGVGEPDLPYRRHLERPGPDRDRPPTPGVVPGSARWSRATAARTTLQVPVTLSDTSAQTVTVPWTTALRAGWRRQPGRPGHRLHPGLGHGHLRPRPDLRDGHHPGQRRHPGRTRRIHRRVVPRPHQREHGRLLGTRLRDHHQRRPRHRRSPAAASSPPPPRAPPTWS